MLPGSGLREEGVERVIEGAGGLVARHLSIRLDPVLQAIQLPARIPDLHPGLTHVDGNTLPLVREKSNIP